jgi:hypothetical protein
MCINLRPELDTPQQSAANGGVSIAPFATAHPNVNRRANSHRIGNAFTYSRKRIPSGTSTTTDKNHPRWKSKNASHPKHGISHYTPNLQTTPL